MTQQVLNQAQEKMTKSINKRMSERSKALKNYLKNWEITNRDNRRFNTIKLISITKNTFFFIQFLLVWF